MRKDHKSIWKKSLAIICWLIFIGCCIQTGVLFINYLHSFVNPSVASDLYPSFDLSEIYTQDKTIFSFVAISLILSSALKAYIFYNVLNLFKFFQLDRPFTIKVLQYIRMITNCTAFLGIFIILTKHIIKHLSEKDYNLNLVLSFFEDGQTYIGAYLILSVITMVFKKGIGLQTENDLTL